MKFNFTCVLDSIISSRKWHLFTVALLVSLGLKAQVISGSMTPGTITAYTYTFSQNTQWGSYYWQTTNGGIINSYTNTTASITWPCTGAAQVKFYGNGVLKATLNVTVSCTTSPTPTGSFTYASNTASALITQTGTPPDNVIWNLQTSTTGTVAADLGPTYGMPGGQVYYLRAYQCLGTCWSSGTLATANIPAKGTVTNGAVCGSGTVTLSATVGSGGTGVRWYNAASGGTVVNTGTTYSVSISATTTYYACTYNSTTGAESPRQAVTGTIDKTGTLSPSTVEVFSNASTPITLTNYTGTIVRWEQNVAGAGWVAVANTTSSYNYSPSPVTTTTSVQIRAVVNNSCGATSYSTVTTATVYAPPVISANGVSPAPATVYVNYGYPVTLATSTYYSYQWNNNGTAIVGATSASYSPTATGVYSITVKGSATSPTSTASVNVVKPNGASDSVNMTSRTIFFKAGQTTASSPFALQSSDLVQALSYSDGLGRPIQTIGIGQAPGQGDVVASTMYGKNGINDTTFLPYTTSAEQGAFRKNTVRGSTAYNSYNSSEQYVFYQGTAKVASDQYPLAHFIYRNTPDARTTEQGTVGSDWQTGTSHTVRNQQALSTSSSYPVRCWKPDGTTSGNYSDRSVSVTIATDENNHVVRSYTDSRGLTVLKQVQADASTWLETYYIYDDFSRLITIVPPKAMVVLGTGASLNSNNSSVADLIFTYSYDLKGRVIQKKVPGSAVQWIVYDQLDRPVLAQTGNQRAQGVWLFSKFDSRNRPVYAGLYTSASDRPTLQSQMDAIDYTTQPWFETRTSTTTYQGYTNTVFPTSNLTLLSVQYYDDYDFNNDGTPDYSYDNTHLTGLPASANAATRGMATGTKRLILGTSNWLINVAFYDNLDRSLQTQSNNHLNLSVQDKTSVLYFTNDLSSHIQKTKATHTGLTTVNVTQRYTYDNAWRALGIYHTINTNAEQQVASYEYNALGQVVDKKLHVNGSSFLQSVDMRYNIRGWLTSINNAQLANDSNLTNDDTNDYFGMELMYNKSEASGLGNTVLFNGNISAVKWKNVGVASGTTDQRSYKFAYDQSDRMTTATFQAFGTDWTKEANTLNENLSFDANGNILALTRNQNVRSLSGTTVVNTATAQDNLTYTYATGNQVSKVDDSSGSALGFNDGANTTTEYNYDINGNLTADQNKNITSITYNALGKPITLTFGDGRSVAYTYDAAGTKLKMVVTQSSTTTTTDYANNYIYTNSTLSFFSSPEGRVAVNGSNYEYQYVIADHEGNTRVVFTSAAPAAVASFADFEGDANDQPTQFSNYGHLSAVHNHTSGGAYSQYLNGSSSGMVGVAKTYKVYPGDQLKIEAYGSYNTPSSNGVNLTAFAGALLNALGLPTPAPGETGTPAAGVNSWGGIEGGGFGDGSTDNTDPKAFVNIVLFDANYNFIDVAYAQLKGTSLYYMTQSYTVKEPGYAYLYVSNEQAVQTDVYFDDVKMTYTPTSILQTSEYYPFGLQTARSWTRDNTTNNFLYDAGSELNKTSGWYDLPARNYDPALGRFFQVDPLASRTSDFTPYHYTGNNPVGNNDPSGLFSGSIPVYDATGNGMGAVPIASLFASADQGGGGGGGDGSQGGMTGMPRYDYDANSYYWDSNGNGNFDSNEQEAAFSQVHSYYSSSFQSGTMSQFTTYSVDENGKAIYTTGVDLIDKDGNTLGTFADQYVINAGPHPGTLVLPWWARAVGTTFSLTALAGTFAIDALTVLVAGDAGKRDDNDKKIYYHYTDAAGLPSILNCACILPNSKGNVYITDAAMSAADAFQNLFLSQTTHAGRGDYVVAFYLDGNQESQLQYNSLQPYEYVWPNGTLKLDQVLWGGPNPFK